MIYDARSNGSGRSVARLARLLGVQEVGSSNLPSPIEYFRPGGWLEQPSVNPRRRGGQFDDYRFELESDRHRWIVRLYDSDLYRYLDGYFQRGQWIER